MQSWMIRLFKITGKAALRDPETRDLGMKLIRALANPTNKSAMNSAPGIAARITNINPNLNIFKNNRRFNVQGVDSRGQAFKVERDLDFMDQTGVFKKKDSEILWGQLGDMSAEQIKQPTANVALRKGIFYNPAYDKASPSYWARFKKTPMIDIDFEDVKSHVPEQVVFKGPKEQARRMAINNMVEYTKNNKKAKFRVYDTSAGMRIFDISRRTTPNRNTFATDKALGGDYKYRGMVHGQKGAFDARLMPKPGRPNDVVATYLGDFGTGPVNPKNLQEVKKYHDDLIRLILQTRRETGDTGMSGLFSRLPATGFWGRTKISPDPFR
tara:strand:+ start:577 stop:1554 length:978 start_codon:yes stop_codon:yes gene_type:complete